MNMADFAYALFISYCPELSSMHSLDFRKCNLQQLPTISH